MTTKCCAICGKPFTPDARTRQFQKVCAKASCRRARKRLADQAWRAKNPGYGAGRVVKTRAWAEQYPDYWKRYRQDHPDYARRNRDQTRARIRASRLVFAKQVAIRKNPVGYLAGLRTRPLFAKQDAITAPIDGILTFLTTRELFAKPNPMAPAGAVVAS